MVCLFILVVVVIMRPFRMSISQVTFVCCYMFCSGKWCHFVWCYMFCSGSFVRRVSRVDSFIHSWIIIEMVGCGCAEEEEEDAIVGQRIA